MLWLKRVLEMLKLYSEPPMKLFCDNKATISIANNPIQYDCTKHVEIDRHFIKKKLESDVIYMPFVTTRQHITDVLTKSLSRLGFKTLVSKLGIISIYAPTLGV